MIHFDTRTERKRQTDHMIILRSYSMQTGNIKHSEAFRGATKGIADIKSI